MAGLLGFVLLVVGMWHSEASASLCPLVSGASVIEQDLTDHMSKILRVIGNPSVNLIRRKEKRSNPVLRVLGYSSLPTVTIEGESIEITFSQCSDAGTDGNENVGAASRSASGNFVLSFISILFAAVMPSWRRTGMLLGVGLVAGSAEATAACQEVLEIELVMPECSICMTGCSPYSSVEEWLPTVNDMAAQCDLMVHTGDLFGSGMACNASTLSAPLNVFKNTSTPALYTIGDNEAVDCFRNYPAPQDFPKAEDARSWLISEYFADMTTDLTGSLSVETQSAQCPFNVYVEKCGVAVVTLEIPGSYWYLHDETAKYPLQDEADPLADRKAMYDTAKDCALAWLDASVTKAKEAGLPGMIIFYHAAFWAASAANQGSKSDWGDELYTKGMGDYYSVEVLGYHPYEPIAEKIVELVDANPDMQFVSGHADWHYWRQQSPLKKANYLDVMVEGSTAGMTSYARFVVDTSETIDPVRIHEVRV